MFIFFEHPVAIAHNVPAVCDGLTARIRACAARPGLANCGGAKYHKGRSPTGVLRNPEPLQRRSAYNPVM